MDIKLIFLDIEGTLTEPNGRGHSPKLLPALKNLMQQNVSAGVLTGRDASYAKAINRLFDLNGPIIAENGCLLIPDFKYDERSSVNYGGFSANKIDSIREKLSQAGILKRMYEDETKRFMFTLYLNDFPNHNPSELAVRCDEIKKILSDDSDLEISYSSAGVDINPKGINKGSAVKKYCDEHGIHLSSVAFVGNSLNDLSAFETIGKAGGTIAVVGNSHELKEKLTGLNPIYTKQKSSEGAVEFIQNILNKTDDS